MELSVELGKWRCDRHDEWKMDEFIRNAAKLEQELAALKEQMRWRSVEDELPDVEHGYFVVLCDGGNVDKSFYTKNRDYLSSLKTSGSYSRSRQGKASGFFEISHRYGYKITHWMPLPTHPTT